MLSSTSKYTIDDIERVLIEQRNEDDIHPAQNQTTKKPTNSGPAEGTDLQQGIEADGDSFMLDMSNEDAVQMVSNVVADHRNHDTLPKHATDEDLMELDGVAPATELGVSTTTFVIDTNFIISHLNILDSLRRCSAQFNHQIVVPRTVIHELDGLKGSNSNELPESQHSSIGALARKANDWIYGNLANLDPSVVGQRLNQKIDFTSSKDDSILDCCLYFKENLHRFVVLLSNDKNLCLKALTEGVLTVSFRKGMSADLIAKKAYEEKNHVLTGSLTGQVDHSPEHVPSPKQEESVPKAAFEETVMKVSKEIEAIALSAIDFVMNAEYGDDLEFTDYESAKVTDLKAGWQCIQRFWMSVFAGYFQPMGIRKETWKTAQPFALASPCTKPELKKFVQFWIQVLHCLYRDRDAKQKQALKILSSRWISASTHGEL